MTAVLEVTAIATLKVVRCGGKNTHFVVIRPAVSSDAPLLEEMHDLQYKHDLQHKEDPGAIYLRYFTIKPELPLSEALRCADVDHTNEETLVAVVAGEVVGFAQYFRLSDKPNTAEVAVFVRYDYLHVGLGCRLLEGIKKLAIERKILFISESHLTSNTAVSALFKRVFPDRIEAAYEDGVTECLYRLAS